MGSVYLARVKGPAGFRRLVAVKLIHRYLMDDVGAVESFVREAKLAVRLSHPNIVQVHDFGEHNGQYLAVLEYIAGYDLGVLAKYLRTMGKAMSMDHAVFVLYKALRGLTFAHELRDDNGEPLGLVHRDISPQNIMISKDGQVSLTDFGIASIQTEATRSEKGDLKGKLAYLAPEQVSGGSVDHRSDLFAVGIVLWEILSGERLFHSDSEAQTIMNVATREIPDISGLRPEVSAEGAAVINRALERDPNKRYQRAEEFAADLRRHCLSSDPDEIEPSFCAMASETFSDKRFISDIGALPDLTSIFCLLYTSPSPRDRQKSRMPSSA